MSVEEEEDDDEAEERALHLLSVLPTYSHTLGKHLQVECDDVERVRGCSLLVPCCV